MRKILIVIALAILCWGCYYTVTQGFSLGTFFTVPNYKQIQTASRGVDTLISQLVNINDTEYPSKQTLLTSAISNYKDKKAEYEELKAMMEQATGEESDVSLVDMYDIDFLWTTIGNYATEDGIKIKMDVAKSLTSSIVSTEYTMCDLKFTVSGDYIPLTDFLFDIEQDNKLGFEISDFSMTKGGDNLQATFTAREVPINNENLSEITTSLDTGTETDINGNTIDTNTVNTNTVDTNTTTVDSNTTANTNTVN